MPLFKTADLPLSAFLQALGHDLVDVQRVGGRGLFVFADNSDLRRDLLRWSTNKPVNMAPRQFVSLLRDLKGVVGL